MIQTKLSSQQQAGDDLSSLAFFLELCGEIYQFIFNLPFIFLALMTCQPNYQLINPPPFSRLILSSLNGLLWILFLPFAVIDLLAEAVVDVVEVAYSTTMYHAVYTGAAIGCLVIGDYEKLGEVREWMSEYYKTGQEGQTIAREIIDEIVEKVVIGEKGTDKTSDLLTDDCEEELPENKFNKSIIQKENESGYLTEADVEE